MEEVRERLSQHESEKTFLQKELVRLRADLGEKREREGQFSRRESELMGELEAGRSERVQLVGELEYLRRSGEERERQLGRAQEERSQWEGKNNSLLLQHN